MNERFPRFAGSTAPLARSAQLNMETETRPTITSRPASLDETTIVVITSIAHALCHLGELIFPSVMIAVMLEFDLAKNQVTAMSLVCWILFGVGALPVGLWADRWDSKLILLIYFLAMAASAGFVVVAQDVWAAFSALTLLGLALSIYHPTGLAMISLGVRAKGRAMGINGVAGSMGIALSPLLGSWAVSVGMWRLAYAVLAGLSAVSAIVMFFVLRQDAHAESEVNAAPLHTFIGPQSISPRRKNYAALVLLFIVMMLAGFNYRCLMTALPTYLAGEEAQGSRFLTTGIAVTLIMLAGAFGQILGGTLADRVGSARVYIFLVGSLIPLSAILGFTAGGPAVMVASLLAVALFAQQPVENTLLAEYTTSGRRSVSYGTKFMLTFGVGALGAQVVGEIWHALGTLNAVFWLITVSSCVMAGLLLVFRRLTTMGGRA